MGTLSEFRDCKIHIELAYLADFIEEVGLSLSVPLTPDGRVSLPYALATLCGLSTYPDVEDFTYLLSEIPALYRGQFVRCWEAIELEVGDDIVVWSEKVGQNEVVRSLRQLSKEIEMS